MQLRIRRQLVLVALVSVTAALAGCSTWAARSPGNRAAAFAEEGRYRDAAREIERAVAAHPDDPRLRRQAAEIYVQLDEPESSIGHVEAALGAEPDDASLWLLLAELEQRRDNLPDAYVAYRRAAELAPDDVAAISGLALTADSLGFEEEAAAAYARWAELEGR